MMRGTHPTLAPFPKQLLTHYLDEDGLEAAKQEKIQQG